MGNKIEIKFIFKDVILRSFKRLKKVLTISLNKMVMA